MAISMLKGVCMIVAAGPSTDNNWSLHSATLGFLRLPTDHTSDSLWSYLHDAVLEWLNNFHGNLFFSRTKLLLQFRAQSVFFSMQCFQILGLGDMVQQVDQQHYWI